MANIILLSSPKSRPMNDDPNDDFVAIDVETASRNLATVCGIGMVRVIDGVIAQRFYTLVNPVRDEHIEKEPNFRIHGIALAEAEKAPSFDKIFPLVKDFIGSLKIVSHNESTDINALKAMMDYYGLHGIDTDNVECTYRLSGKSLVDCCKDYGIKLGTHHNALHDAEACARIYLQLIGKPLVDQAIGSPKEILSNKAAKLVDKQFKQQLDECDVSNKDTVFFGSTVVITGTFEDYPERNNLAAKLQALGAKVSSSISKKTDIVVVGDGAGPKKLEKIHEMQSEGHCIRAMYEAELKEILY